MGWKVGVREAHIERGGWSGMLQPPLPSAGIELSNTDWDDTSWRLLAANPSPRHSSAIEEQYLRGDDLIVRYKQTEKDRFSYQLDWRSIPLEPESYFEFGIELWISIQTSLLDCHPTLELTSEVAGSTWEVFQDSDLMMITKKGGQPLKSSQPTSPAAIMAKTDLGTVVLLVYRSDQSQVEYQEVKRKSVRSIRLFGQFMEKGVIRRARVRVLATAGDVDKQQLCDAYGRFQDSPLPLTT